VRKHPLRARTDECGSSRSPHARALDAPSRGARFDGYAVPVTPERFFWWTERRFHRLMTSPEPSGAQAPAPRPHRRVWKLSFTPGESARLPVAGGSFRRLRGSSDAGAILLVDQATVPPPHDGSRAGRCASTRSAPAQTCVEALVHAPTRVLARPSGRSAPGLTALSMRCCTDLTCSEACVITSDDARAAEIVVVGRDLCYSAFHTSIGRCKDAPGWGVNVFRRRCE
jgi:hypothetical protein